MLKLLFTALAKAIYAGFDKGEKAISNDYYDKEFGYERHGAW